jgi:hypothetical protein
MSRISNTAPHERLVLVLSLLPAVSLGLLISVTTRPELIVFGSVATLLALAVLTRLGSLGALMLVLFTTILIPVTVDEQGFSSGALAQHGSALRVILLVALTLFSLSMLPATTAYRRNPAGPCIALLLSLAAVGVGVAAVNAESSNDFVALLSQAAGQPLLYAGLLFAFVHIIRDRRDARVQHLSACAVGAILEAVLVGSQLATSAAFDPIRGITRASGTVGADFLGAFGALTVFAMLDLRRTAPTPRTRLLASAGVVAGIVAMTGSVSRGPTAAFIVGLAFLVLSATGNASRRRRRLLTAAAVTVVFICALFVLHGPWTARLGSTSGSGFDRPQTWVSAVRIAEDHPVTGVGSTRLATVVNSNPRYYETPYGHTKVNPHNAWLYALDSAGVMYALIFLAATFAFVRAVWSKRSDPESVIPRCALLAAALMFAINNLFTHPEVMVYLLCLGAMAMEPTSRAGKQAPS